MAAAYEWQLDCLNKWESGGRRGIVQAVTGAGKTMLAMQALERLCRMQGSLHVWVVVPTSALQRQWSRVFRECSAKWEEMTDFHCEVCVINSARYRVARAILQELRRSGTVFLIADECHRYASPENRKIFEFVPYLTECPGVYCALGLSATIQGMDAAGVLQAGLGQIIYRYPYERALRDGVIAEFVLFQIALDFDADEYGAYQNDSEEMKAVKSRLCAMYPSLGEHGVSFFAMLQELAKDGQGPGSRMARRYLSLSYHRKRLVCMAKRRISCVRLLLGCLDIRRKIMIFGESIDQADALYRSLREDYGSKVGRYHSKAGDQANRNALSRFRNGEILILITCKALDEGVDVPDAGVGIILSGTGVERQRIQRLGRILRKSEEKPLACLYYLFIRESSEERGYFPTASEHFCVENLTYCSEGEFEHPHYERAAEKLLSVLAREGCSLEALENAGRCLARGKLRGDGLLSDSQLEAWEECAVGSDEKAYWAVMRRMAEYLRCDSTRT